MAMAKSKHAGFRRNLTHKKLPSGAKNQAKNKNTYHSLVLASGKGPRAPKHT